MAVEVIEITIPDAARKASIERAVVRGLTRRGAGPWKVWIVELASEPTIIIRFTGPASLEHRFPAVWAPQDVEDWLANVNIL